MSHACHRFWTCYKTLTFCSLLTRCTIPCACNAKRRFNVQKWRVHVVFCTFWLRNVLRATTACTFSTSQLPKVVRTWGAFSFFTCKCASRHNGVQFFISHLARWLRTRRFSEPTFRPSGATNHGKNTSVSRLSYLFAHLHLLSSDSFSSLLFSLLLSSSLWLFPSLLFICPYCRKFDFETSFDNMYPVCTACTVCTVCAYTRAYFYFATCMQCIIWAIIQLCYFTIHAFICFRASRSCVLKAGSTTLLNPISRPWHRIQPWRSREALWHRKTERNQRLLLNETLFEICWKPCHPLSRVEFVLSGAAQHLVGPSGLQSHSFVLLWDTISAISTSRTSDSNARMSEIWSVDSSSFQRLEFYHETCHMVLVLEFRELVEVAITSLSSLTYFCIAVGIRSMWICKTSIFEA